MPAEANAVKDVFLAALEKDTPAERSAYLDTACAGDAELRRRVEAMLHAHDRPDRLLDRPATELLSGIGDTMTLDFLGPATNPGALGRLGHYEVLEVAGRGGMGVVLRAFDEKLHRVVAIKVLPPALSGSATARRRFVREARAAAAVVHENVIGIHAVEDDGPVPYIVMQFVEGKTLKQKIDRTGALPLHETLRIGVQIADGLAAAHKHGLVHRDIKPANILLENGIERVKITDFGLARATDDASITGQGVIAGTPSYMSPEQAGGEKVDHRGDLFSLGGVLYAMCTGRDPFAGDSMAAVFQQVLAEQPPPIRDSNPAVPAWLVALVDRLLAKNPADRFQSAAEVSAALGRRLAELQAGGGSSATAVEPAPTGPAQMLERAIASGKRPSLRWAALAVLLAATVGVVWIVAKNRPGGQESAKADSPGQGHNPNPQPAPPVSEPAPALPAEPIPLKPAKTLTGHTNEVLVVAYSPDGKLLASAGEDRTIHLWETETWKSRSLPTEHPDSIVGLAFSPDGKLLASVTSGSDSCCVRLWDPATGKQEATMGGAQSGQWAIAFSPDGTRLATGGWDKTLRIWDVATREEKLSVAEVCPQFIRGLGYSPKGDRIVVGGSGPTRLFDAKTGELVVTEPMTNMCPTFLPSGDGAAGWVHGNGRVVVFNLPSGRLRMSWPAHRTQVEGRGLIEGLAASPDGRFVASLGPDGVARVWYVIGTDPVEVATLTGHRGGIYYAAFTPDGKQLATAGKDDFTVRLWDLPPVCHVRK